MGDGSESQAGDSPDRRSSCLVCSGTHVTLISRDMVDPAALNIDSIIARLLEGQSCGSPAELPLTPQLRPAVRGSRPGKNVQLTETEIKSLCMKSREIFLSQPILLELEAPLKICGTWSSSPAAALGGS